MGRNENDVRHDPVTQAHFQRFAQAEQQLRQVQAPLLLDADNPHQRLYVAAMDGTGNSIYKDAPENWSAVGKIYSQLQETTPDGVGMGYVEGIGTQDGWWPNRRDGLTGHTFEARLETAYYKFCQQAKLWMNEDPQVDIRVAGIGFSRGAELSAALSRMIHERGIMDPDTANIQKDALDLVVSAEYTRQLVPPGRTLQTVVLFDPVATNITEHDRRIQPSTVGGIALMSEDARDQFKGTRFFPDGLSEQGRFFSVTLPGAHSDTGNSYARDGLGVLSANLAVDYLNSLSNRDWLQKQPVPQDPARYVIHRSEDHMAFYSTRGMRDGERDFIDQLGPERVCRVEPQPDCTRKAPHDAALAAQVEWRDVRIQPALAPPELRSDPQAMRADRVEDMFMRMTDAAMRGDRAGMLQVGSEYRDSPDGQAWLQQGRDYNQQQQQALQEQQAEQARQQLEQQQADMQRSAFAR